MLQNFSIFLTSPMTLLYKCKNSKMDELSLSGPRALYHWIKHSNMTGINNLITYRTCPLNWQPSHSFPAKFTNVLIYFPFLFGKKLFSMQDKLVSNKQTHFLKQNFSAIIAPNEV